MKGVFHMTETTTYIKRGDIFYVDLGNEQKGSIQNGIRPCVICGNNMQNKYSSVIMISPITSSIKKKDIPTHLKIKASDTNLAKDSTILFEQILTIQKSQLREKVCSLSNDLIKQANEKIMISLGLAPVYA